MEEQENVALIAAEVAGETAVWEELRQRVQSLESALNELRNENARSVAVSAASGRRTVATAPAREGAAALDAALGSLSLEQRIAVKSQMLRSGLL